jgi:hypothetical protein
MALAPRKAEIILEYQNYIETPPMAPSQMYGQACSSDGVTIDSWRDKWLDNIRANKAKYGEFKPMGIGQLFGRYRHQPCVVAGSGPSLKYNGPLLANRDGIPLVSCLHNFHYLEDVGASPEFYVTLDAGEVTVEEVYEGGKMPPEYYWERTKDRTLLAYIGTHPKLLEKWQGKVYFFNAPVPDPAFLQKCDDIEPFHTYIGNGGNVLGACLYIAKAIFGGNPIAFVGADFCFSYDKKFHAWDSKYDAKLGRVLKAVDVFGNKVLTWQSYFNFKNWFDYIALTVPGIYINCSEGGTLGAYPDGNLMAIQQMELKRFIDMYRMFEEMRDQCENPETQERKLLF